MKLCVNCFWYDDRNDGTCLDESATVVSPVDGKRHQRACETQRRYGNLPDSCGEDAKFWMDMNCDVCRICDKPIAAEDSIGDDEPMHVNCAVGRAESRSEGDR